jgi:hypothetical protein
MFRRIGLILGVAMLLAGAASAFGTAAHAGGSPGGVIMRNGK